MVTRFPVSDKPFHQLRQEHAAELKAWAATWRKLNREIPGNLVGLIQIGGGMRDVKGAVFLQSEVLETGALVYGVPIAEAFRGVQAVQILPTLLTGRHVSEAEGNALLDEYFTTAQETGGFVCAERALQALQGFDVPPMKALNAVISLLPEVKDPWRETAMYMGAVPYIVAALYCLAEGRPLPAIPKTLHPGIAETFVSCLQLQGDPAAAIRMVNAYLGWLSTHGVNIGSKAAQDTASSGGTIQESVISGWNNLATVLHGGAQGLVSPMLFEIKRDLQLDDGQVPTFDQLCQWTVTRLRTGGKLSGIGHAVIENVHDPRSVALRDLGLTLPGVADAPLFKLMCGIMDLMPDVLADERVTAVKKLTQRFTNVDFVAGPLQELVLGVRNPKAHVLLFALARFVDYCVSKHHLMAMGLPIARMDALNRDAIDRIVANTH